MAELWQGLRCLLTAALAACDAARLSFASNTATSQALQAAMPVLQDQYFRFVSAFGFVTSACCGVQCTVC